MDHRRRTRDRHPHMHPSSSPRRWSYGATEHARAETPGASTRPSAPGRRARPAWPSPDGAVRLRPAQAAAAVLALTGCAMIVAGVRAPATAGSPWPPPGRWPGTAPQGPYDPYGPQGPQGPPPGWWLGSAPPEFPAGTPSTPSPKLSRSVPIRLDIPASPPTAQPT